MLAGAGRVRGGVVASAGVAVSGKNGLPCRQRVVRVGRVDRVGRAGGFGLVWLGWSGWLGPVCWSGRRVGPGCLGRVGSGGVLWGGSVGRSILLGWQGQVGRVGRVGGAVRFGGVGWLGPRVGLGWSGRVGRVWRGPAGLVGRARSAWRVG